MIKHLKGCLASALLAIALCAGGFALPKAHASMPDPEYYNSTSHRDNVYYGVSYPNKRAKYGFSFGYFYGRMPKQMLNKGHIFPLYYGNYYHKINYIPKSGSGSYVDRVIHRHGATYLPDYVGYVTGEGNDINADGHKGNVMDILINKRDIGKPVKNQAKLMNPPYFRSARQLQYHPALYGKKAQRYYHMKANRRVHIRRYRRAIPVYRYHKKSANVVQGYWATKHHLQIWGLTFLKSGVAFNPSGAAINNWSHPAYKYADRNAFSIYTSRKSRNNAGRVRGEHYYIKLGAHHQISVWANGRYIGSYHKVSRHYLFG